MINVPRMQTSKFLEKFLRIGKPGHSLDLHKFHSTKAKVQGITLRFHAYINDGDENAKNFLSYIADKVPHEAIVDQEHEFWESKELEKILEELYIAMGVICPEGFYFGEDDHGLLGFWPVDEE